MSQGVKLKEILTIVKGFLKGTSVLNENASVDPYLHSFLKISLIFLPSLQQFQVVGLYS